MIGVPSDRIPGQALDKLTNARRGSASPLSRNAFMFSNCLLEVATLAPILPALKEEFAGRVPSQTKSKTPPEGGALGLHGCSGNYLSTHLPMTTPMIRASGWLEISMILSGQCGFTGFRYSR